jgi:hypothetical protein
VNAGTIVLVAGQGNVPQLVIGNVGQYPIAPSGVFVDVDALGDVAKAIIVATTRNCEISKAKAIMSDAWR